MAAITHDKATLVSPGATRPSVDSLDLEIADGEFVVGPSGCGKSTSLRMPVGGKLLILRADPRRPPEKGEVVHVSIRPGEVHVFSPDSGAPRLGCAGLTAGVGGRCRCPAPRVLR